MFYDGHGAVKDGKLIWSASIHPALSWYELQGPLERVGFDVLLILDCCHAAGSVTKGGKATMEVLAAGFLPIGTAGSSTRPRTARTAWVGASHSTTWYASPGNQYRTGTSSTLLKVANIVDFD